MLRLVLVLFVPVLITSCINFEPFQPPPPVYKQWNKSGENEIAIQKAMLECGYLSPYGNPRLNDISEVVLMHRCMEASGYIYEDHAGDFCNGFKVRPIACEVSTQAPRRSKEMRTNGAFCRANQGSPICSP